MQSPKTKPQNSKLEAMRNRIKLNSPLTIGKPKPQFLQINTATTLQDEVIVSSPVSGDKSERFSSFSTWADNDKFYLKNAFEQKYQILQKLGEGGNGVVRKCMDRETNQIFAVKIGKMDQQHLLILQRIVNMMKKLKHESILQIKQLYRDHKRSKYYHVIQYLPYPQLKQLINQGYQFTPDQIKKIMKQLLSALEYFHKHFIVHRDIKTSNILYDVQNNKVILIDLGIITKTVHRGKRRNLWSNNGTLEYKAPQMLMGSSYNEAVDNWAAGVVLYELVQKRTPFKQESHFDIIENITSIKYSFDKQLWNDIPLAKQLVSMLLKPKNQRLTAKQALKAPWFQQIDWSQMTIKRDSPDSASKKNNITGSISFSKQKLGFGSVMMDNNQLMDIDNELDEYDFQGLSVINPYHLRMSNYEQLIKKKSNKENKQLLNVAEILGIAEDDMIINNNA